MTKRGLLPLESFQLVQYAVQVPCFVCEGGNSFDAELCRHCRAPLALAYQASAKVKPHLIAALGPPACGKTVYLGMLMDMLSHPNDVLQVLARGAFSVSLQQTTMSALSRCQFPPPTPPNPEQWNWVHCQVHGGRRRRAEFILPDMSGEAVLDEVEHPYRFPLVRAYLNKSHSAVVLIDAARLEAGDREPEFQSLKMLSYLCELNDHRKRGWGNRPVALVFTKSDQCDSGADDPREYGRQRTPGLFRFCEERLRRHAFFAAGVIGAMAQRRELGGLTPVPLRVEPRGVIEPLAWVLEQLQ